MPTVERRLADLGLALPTTPVPVGHYVPAVRAGNLVFTSGQTARLDGVRRYVGTVGRDVTPEDAYRSARDSALNCLACVKSVVGSLDRVVRAVKIVGFVNTVEGFVGHSAVIDGASDLLVELFGERGRPARSAVGVRSLPSNVSVELELIVQVEAPARPQLRL
jgi:enamine deaminase RidA (YjgF/YER057c/UK114 family)